MYFKIIYSISIGKCNFGHYIAKCELQPHKKQLVLNKDKLVFKDNFSLNI